MQFADIPYERPNLEELRQQFEELIQALPDADAAAQIELIRAGKKLRSRFMTQQSLCHIRHTSNTKDPFYEEENAFFDEAGPEFDGLVHRFFESLIQSPHREEISGFFGPQFMRRVEVSLRSFDPSTIAQLGEENQLASTYTKIKAQASISFKGKKYNLSSIEPLMLDKDRSVRKAASAAYWQFFADHEEELSTLFAKLVGLRTEIARQMGMDNYVELGYDRMSRTDYTAADISAFRDQIRKHIVPLAGELYERQRERLGIEELYLYDEGLFFPQGNARPKGTPEDTLAAAEELYNELSPETAAFFEMMRERQLMDLVARDAKATGGYCTYLYKYCVPFIFSNFNGTSGDIDVLTHELGHAFQMYESRNQPIIEYILPTYEACEIHSMSMEFFAYPWMEAFFGEQADQYRTQHLESAIRYLPYIALVDHFQQSVYEQPELDAAGRMELWSQLESQYMPFRKYDDNDLLSRGGFWLKQSHIFQVPFYYIDYALAQVCAFQFWQRDLINHRDAWGDYLKLCKAGGSASFLELVEVAHLESPFAPGVVANLAKNLRQYLKLQPSSALAYCRLNAFVCKVSPC